jgi:hypothetical protein
MKRAAEQEVMVKEMRRRRGEKSECDSESCPCLCVLRYKRRLAYSFSRLVESMDVTFSTKTVENSNVCFKNKFIN